MDSSTSGGSLGSTSHTSLLTAACNASRVLRWTTRAIGVWPSSRWRVETSFCGTRPLRVWNGVRCRWMTWCSSIQILNWRLLLAVAGFVFVAGGVPIAPCGHRAIGLELPLDAAADHVAIGFDVLERGFGAGGGIGLGGAVLDLPIPAMVAGEVEDGGIYRIAVLEDAAGDREPEPDVLAGAEPEVAAVALGVDRSICGRLSRRG